MLEIRKLWEQSRIAPDNSIFMFSDKESNEMEALGVLSTPSVYETLYAYLLTYPGSVNPTAGRFRVAVYETSHENIHQITGMVEQWTPGGWIYCFQLVDDSYSNPQEATEKLRDMMKMFLVGKNEGEEDFSFAPRTPPKKKKQTPKSGTDSVNFKKPVPDSGDDFEWI